MLSNHLWNLLFVELQMFAIVFDYGQYNIEIRLITNNYQKAI